MAVSVDGAFVATISGCTLHVYNVAKRRLLRHVHVRALTTVAFHPQNSCIATGDAEGQIVLWHNFKYAAAAAVGDGGAGAVTSSSSSAAAAGNKTKKTLVTVLLHWHAHAVRATAFSDDGTYLLSGGEEAGRFRWCDCSRDVHLFIFCVAP
jgi:NET1-associated nuclear protein 1 (U3 small nucleolar RNA-associated protein 17)